MAQNKLKPAFAWIMRVSIHAFILVQGLFLLHFYTHRDYYSREVCIQKDNPKNCCQGSCVIEKTISLPNQSENQAPNLVVWTEDFIIENPGYLEQIVQSVNSTIVFSDLHTHKGYSSGLERPPNA